jgi:hypothetical protein
MIIQLILNYSIAFLDINQSLNNSVNFLNLEYNFLKLFKDKI